MKRNSKMIDVNKEQRRASNPLSSVWVSASAGSGKTKVLTDRVLNLLLLSGRPEKILCLTFTKTAAAEMTNRINKVLKSWVIMPDTQLADEI
ncbi:MAG: UvrD-helicase domain-containing protein, partial [Alphaproteobacteria bacterium]|nr:UvrD-helicase domain-containing protein [Alphaproteobacteria bacterium]